MSSMNWLSVIVAAAVGGGVGSAVTSMMAPELPAKEPVKVAETEAKDEGDDQGLNVTTGGGTDYDAKLQKLERRISLLTASVGQAKGIEKGGDPALDPADVDVADPVFEAAVLDIMDREQERKESERKERREELRNTQTTRMTGKLGQQLGLDTSQQEQVQAVIKAHFQALSDLRQSENAPVTRREWRDKMSEMSAEAEAKLNAIFTSEQKKQYDELDPDDKVSFGFGSRSRSREANTETQGSRE